MHHLSSSGTRNASGRDGAAAGYAAGRNNTFQYSGAQGAAAGAAAANRNAPQYSGAQGAAAGAAAANRNAPQYSGAAGAAAGYATASNRFAAGFNQVTPTARYSAATAVRGNFNHYDAYGANWYRANPDAWHPSAWNAATAWTPAAWTSLASWLGQTATQPVSYNYGSNVAYRNNSVYVDGQAAGTAQQYYDQAQTLANTGAQADVSGEGDWLSLGVFALCKDGQTSSDLVLQLGVNKQGIVRGNYADGFTHKSQVIRGSVEKQTQRVAFTVGDNQTTVVEVGLYNLTQDEAPAVLYFGQDRTEQWLLVRMKQSSASSQPSP